MLRSFSGCIRAAWRRRGMPRTSLRASLADEEDPEPPEFTQPPCQRLAADYDPDELLGIVQAYGGQVIALDACLGAFLDDLAARSSSPRISGALIASRRFRWESMAASA